MIDRVLCALPFKDTAFGLTRANHPLSLQLSPLFYFTISALNLTDQIFVLIIVQCIQMWFTVCYYRSIGRTPFVTAIIEICFARVFFPDCCCFLSFAFQRIRVRWVNLWFRRIGWFIVGFPLSLSLSLFLSSSLLGNSCGFTRWHDATRHWLLRVRISNFRTFSTNFRWWICANLVPWIFERAFFLLFFNFCARFRRMDGSQAGSSPRKRESLLSRV